MVILVVIGCEEGLQPPNGFEGTVRFPTNESGEVIWPDSLEAAVVAFADASKINFQQISFTEVLDHLLGYSQPLDTAEEQQDYFLQALAGPDKVYIAGVVATRVPFKQIIATPIDSLGAHPEYFQIIGIHRKEKNDISFIYVDDEEITSGIDIEVNYDFTF